MVDALRVAVIIGSTRQGRVCPAVGAWFANQAADRPDIHVEPVDLAEFILSDDYAQAPTHDTRRFLKAINQAEAFVVVTPEYNRSFPAPLKRAIDHAYDEWHAKPVAIVSYGTRSDGLYATEQLRQIFTELHAVTVRNRLGLDLLRDLDPDGTPYDTDDRRQALSSMLDQLVWWGLALREARRQRPYVS